MASYAVCLVALVDVASLVALVGEAGLAIGLALKGTLSNTAAGIMILFLKPNKKVGLLNSEAAQVAWLILVYSLPCFRRQMAFTFLVRTVLFGAQLFVILVIATNVVCISWLVSLTNI